MNTNDDVNQKISDLEKIACEILELKKQNRLRRPLIVEFCGSPKSGKSTCINSLNSFLKRNSFKSKVLSEKASICPVKKKTSPNFNIWTFCSTLSDYLDLIQEDHGYDIILIDRGIFDSLCWIQWLITDNKLSNEEMNIIESFITLKRWMKSVDMVYVFKASPDVSLQREYKHLLTRKEGSIMNTEMLSKYYSAIDTTITKYESTFSKVLNYDTSSADQNQVNYDTTKAVLEGLKDLLIEKIAYFSSEDLPRKLKSGINSFDLLNDLVLSYGDRDQIEKSNNIQPIPVAVITSEDNKKVLVVKKNSESLESKSPEKDKYITWIGGHVRREDSIKVDNIFDTFKNALEREIQEEIGIDFSLSNHSQQPFLVYTPNGAKSMKHLAVCFHIKMNENTKLYFNSHELMDKTSNSKYGKFHEISLLEFESDKFEDWSIEIIKEVFEINPHQKTLFDLINED